MTVRTNHSIVKAFALLKSFRHAEDAVMCSDLCRRAHLPESSSQRLLTTMAEIGAVVRDAHGRYRPGLLLVSLSRNVAVDDCLYAAARAVMAELSEHQNVTLHLARLEDFMVTYVARFSTAASCQTDIFPGMQLEPYNSGVGKILLAALPQAELDKYIARGELVALTPYTITDPVLLAAELEKVRRRGYALDDREFRLDRACVAVPVLDGGGRTIASISATERPEKMTPARREELRLALVEAAAALSRNAFPTPPEAESRQAGL